MAILKSVASLQHKYENKIKAVASLIPELILRKYSVKFEFLPTM